MARKVVGFVIRMRNSEGEGFFTGKNRQTGAPKIRQRNAYIMDEKRLAWAEEVLEESGDCTWQIHTIYEGRNEES